MARWGLTQGYVLTTRPEPPPLHTAPSWEAPMRLPGSVEVTMVPDPHIALKTFVRISVLRFTMRPVPPVTS